MSRSGPIVVSKKGALFLVLVVFAVTAAFQYYRPLPRGLDREGPSHVIPSDRIAFLADLTYSKGGRRVSVQNIFDEVLKGIAGARNYILLDMFLFNEYGGAAGGNYRGLAEEITDALVARLKRSPNLRVDIITDPINTVYGGAKSWHLDVLREAGAHVVVTDLGRLRDSNLFYAVFYRAFLQWFGNSDGGGFFPHPFDGAEDGVTLRSYLRMLNFKANHRKVFVADGTGGWTTIVTSANPHDGSSRHSNVALKINGPLWWDIYDAEEAVADFSASPLGPRPPPPYTAYTASPPSVDVTVLTESAIREAVLDLINRCGEGDTLWIAMFYLSERSVVDALVAASQRGADVRCVLDANRDAFGFEKSGIPNRPVAAELRKRSDDRIEVRWYRTEGEQFHTKLVFADRAGGGAELILGSANLTRRNLGNYNLELDVMVSGTGRARPMSDVRHYLERIWFNRLGDYTLPYSEFGESSIWKTVAYRFQEWSGLSSF